MRTIDIHAHVVPPSLWRTVDAGQEWYGFRQEPDGSFLGGGKRNVFSSPKVRLTPEERLQDMDSQGVDVQVLSIHTPFFGYHLDPAQGLALARDFNDEVAGLVRQWPERFAGLATLPMQDVPGGGRRAGARGDRARPEGGRARHRSSTANSGTSRSFCRSLKRPSHSGPCSSSTRSRRTTSWWSASPATGSSIASG